MRRAWWTATLARLIEHAQAARAKLVLVGDYEQLAEIEAGGLFRALAERGEPVHLDEVIRHRYEVDREGAKLIREGEGRKALALYESSERVVIAPDAEARREAMVADWWQSFSRGEDAVMVERDRAALLAAHLRPPAYVVAELGERPTNSRLASPWDKGVGDIERYRREHGVTDRERAFGPKPGREHEFEHIAHRDATRRLQDRQAQLGRGREAGRGREIGRSFGLGR